MCVHSDSMYTVGTSNMARAYCKVSAASPITLYISLLYSCLFGLYFAFLVILIIVYVITRCNLHRPLSCAVVHAVTFSFSFCPAAGAAPRRAALTPPAAGCRLSHHYDAVGGQGLSQGVRTGGGAVTGENREGIVIVLPADIPSSYVWHL